VRGFRLDALQLQRQDLQLVEAIQDTLPKLPATQSAEDNGHGPQEHVEVSLRALGWLESTPIHLAFGWIRHSTIGCGF